MIGIPKNQATGAESKIERGIGKAYMYGDCFSGSFQSMLMPTNVKQLLGIPTHSFRILRFQLH